MKNKLLMLGMIMGIATASHAETGPIRLAMLKKPYSVDPVVIKGMVESFEKCLSKEALPQSVMAPLGAQYLNSTEYPTFSFANALPDRSLLVLRGNDAASMYKVGDGRYMTYGSYYHFKKPLKLTPDVYLLGVKTFANVETRATVGVTYLFNTEPADALGIIDDTYNTHLKSKLGIPGLDSKVAKPSDVWLTVDQAAKSVTCWRFP